MIIANPIYDSVFKFLLEDIEVAKRFISNIIGEEIIELTFKPQEQTTLSPKYLLTVFRLDFKALIKTPSGGHKKVLIELQKSNNGFDIMRFKHYIGTNYSKADEVNGIKTPLPMLPIYILGFKLSIERAVLKIGRQYQDVSTGEIYNAKDDFIEQLSHDCFVIQVPCLPEVTQTKLEKILSVFNQKWVFDKDTKWLMRYDNANDDDDEDQQLIVRRLAIAAESEEVQQSVVAEENFETTLDEAFREKERIIEQKELVIEQKEQLLQQKEQDLVIERQKADAERQKNEDLLRRIAELEKLMKK
ncbi:MAG: hypothetical protein KA783_00905 [Chitinophagales bacterium]|nr:hypothetical protein [Sphingobacteriales bacterium]MBP7532984.1 hypothetical protein [Chitinophagales bacterium]